MYELNLTEDEAALVVAASQMLFELSCQMGAKTGNYEAADLRVTLNEQLVSQGFDADKYVRRSARPTGDKT